MTRAFRRVGGFLAAAALAAGPLAACGGSDEPETAPGQEPEESSLSSATPGSESAGESTDPDNYLPVPQGVQLTSQGSELALQKSAVVAWEPRQDLVGVLDVTVTRLQQTTFAHSFQGWQIDETEREATPYFVQATIENVGESDVGGRDVPLYAVDATNTLIEASGFKARFDPCPGNGVFPETFGPKGAKDVCLVYLVPGGTRLTAVSFRPNQDFDPIIWTGRIEKPQKR